MNAEINLPKKPKKSGTKGIPQSIEEGGKISNNLKKTSSTEFVPINLNVKSEFKKRMKIFALDQEMTLTDLIIESVEQYMEKN